MLKRYTAYIRISGRQGSDIEEIDVDAENMTQAREKARMEAVLDYTNEYTWAIVRIVERVGLYM